MIKLTNVYIPNSTIILKFTGNHDSEDIAERIDPEYSDNDTTASTQFQGMPIEISKTINSIHRLRNIK